MENSPVKRKPLVANFSTLLCVTTLLMSCAKEPTHEPADADAIVVGAGLSGLSAAVEMGRAGIRVLVVDINSVPGGTAVRAGGVALVGTPVQEQAGFRDSPDLAYRDWLEWTEDGDPEWTRYYAEHSRDMIYDWLTEMGVEFVRVAPSHGNSVPRFHFTAGRAVHLILPLYRAALGMPNVSFLFNSRARELVTEDGRIAGVTVVDLRSRQARTLRAPNVVLATGGFAGNLERVRANWLPALPQAERLMVGASVRATGSGHDMASAVGASLAGTNRHYIYINGLPDPRDPEQLHALTAGNDMAMWVNANGKRFTNEAGYDKDILVDLLQQEPATYWMIFDEASRDEFGMRGAAWLKNRSEKHPILDNPETAKRAQSIKELAAAAGLPADELEKSVSRFNSLIDAGEDADFGRFSGADQAPPKIEKPPFYAVQMYPMTRKTMGGVVIDRQARVLDGNGQAIGGLYAAGELTGSVGINGKHGLDGMFLGPAVLTGRLAGRSIAASLPDRPPPESSQAVGTSTAGDWLPGAGTFGLEPLLATGRAGYWHFERSHRLVVERGYDCERCHSAELPFGEPVGLRGQLMQTETCLNCH